VASWHEKDGAWSELTLFETTILHHTSHHALCLRGVSGCDELFEIFFWLTLYRCKTGENTSTDHGIIFKYNTASISNRKMGCALLVLIYEYSWYISSRWISFIGERSRNIYPTKPICKVICKLGQKLVGSESV
jgi:hypothetical protein